MYQELQGRLISEFGILKENFESKILRENGVFRKFRVFPQFFRAFESFQCRIKP